MSFNSVMVVDDDDAIREAVKEILEMEGYEVTTARNGAEALDLLNRSPPPCVILLDLMMPVLNGWQFLEAKKKTAAIVALPVVVVSAVADHQREKDHGATQIVRKPPDVDSLLKIVEHYCHAAAMAPKAA
ncbi:MAG: response regulator [Methylotenera sp.]|nr:response regulator [Oligoflexia bacterium]